MAIFLCSHQPLRFHIAVYPPQPTANDQLETCTEGGLLLDRTRALLHEGKRQNRGIPAAAAAEPEPLAVNPQEHVSGAT